MRIRWPGDKKVSSVPLVPKGKRYATKNRVVAIQVAKNLIRAKTGDKPPPHSADIVEQFGRVNSLKANPVTVAQNKSRVRRFLKSIGHDEPDLIATSDIEDFLISLRGAGLSEKTTHNYLASIGAFCKFAVRRGYADINAARLVELAPLPKRPPNPPSTRAVLKLLRLARQAPIEYRDDLYLACRVAVATGARRSEFAKLTVTAIRQRDKGPAILIGEEDPTKSNSYRIVPIAAPLARRLKANAKDEYLFSQVTIWSWYERMKKLIAQTGDITTRKGTGRHWHALRSYCATIKAKTYTEYKLTYEMGWATPEMAQRYIDMERAAR